MSKEEYVTYPLLNLMNRYENPEVKVGVHVVQGRHGELYVTARPVEAWDLWAETNGYSDATKFMKDFEDEFEWSDDYRRGFLDECGSITYVEVTGYYRDGVEHL